MTEPMAHDSRSDAEAPLRFERILAPTDFSDSANHALALALDLARRYGAEVRLLHVIGPVEGDAWGPLRYTAQGGPPPESPEQAVLALLRAELDRQHTEGVPVEPATRRGSAPGAAILEYARAEGVDLIVMGTHGRGPVQRLSLGSAATRTLRHATCPVLTVREGVAGQRRDVRRVLAPLDFSEHSAGQLWAARDLAAAYGAQIDLLHVIEPLPFLGLLTGVMSVRDVVPDILEQADAAMERMWEEVAVAEVAVKRHVEEGHAAARIVDFAARVGADLIVIGAQGHAGIERFLIGSVTERVVRTAPCPVMCFK